MASSISPRRRPVKPAASQDDPESAVSIRSVVQFSERRFDIRTLPNDMQRVYKALAGRNYENEEYALAVIFTMRTAIELHRAWHMTLLTNKILQQLKDRFRLRMTWDLGVFRLNFRLEDGGKELARKVPYDYDSENQDIYMRIAIALMDGAINVHEALIYQSETVEGVHTAKSGKFLRDFPGRIVLYPLVASTCAVIFFNGDWVDFGIAALCGFAMGIVEFCLGYIGAGILTDVLVGTTTGVIGGLFFRYLDTGICLSSIFLGSLYWYFYGTAFVIGILEIIAGELETGVTRFIAVSVKTFVLCLGASFGLLVVGNAEQAWFESQEYCGTIDLDAQWWRILLYLLCSVAVLGQYRFPIVRYWRALAVMLVGYEVQYVSLKYFSGVNEQDNLDTAISNVFGSAASVACACLVSYYVNKLRYYTDARILRKDEENSCKGKFIYNVMAFGVRVGDALRLGRSSDRAKLDLEKKLSQARKELKDPSNSRDRIDLDPAEENLIIETIVGSQDLNIWSVLMPALYQLVPGSMIAKLWFNYIFPPPLLQETKPIEGSDGLFYTTYSLDEAATNVFANLMIISTSLALGLILGFAFVQISEKIFFCDYFKDKLKTDEQLQRAKDRRAGMYSLPKNATDDPDIVALEFRKAILHGATTEEEAEKIFNAVDWDGSDTIDLGELSDYMLNAGLTSDQVHQLFSSMDADSSGEVSRTEFCRAILDKKNEGLLKPKENDDLKPPNDGKVADESGASHSILSGQYPAESEGGGGDGGEASA